MELITLDSNFRAIQPISNFKSLIWTERYASYGDFELQSSNIAETVKALQRETYVSLRDSPHPFIVEDHKIVKPDKEAPYVVVTGSSFETVLTRRWASKDALPITTGRTAFTVDAVKESDAAYLAMRIVIGDNVRIRNGVPILPAISPAASPLDAIPEIDLTLPADYVDVNGVTAWNNTTTYVVNAPVKKGTKFYRALSINTNADPDADTGNWKYISEIYTYTIKFADLYSAAMELITTNHHGLKAIRPLNGSPKTGVEVYNGADLTDTVVFNVKFDQFDSATYFLSSRGSANIGYVFGPGGAEIVNKTTTTEPSGLARRVLGVDLSSESTANSVDARRNRALIELYKLNNTALFDGELAAQLAAGYNTKYFLGDIVKLVGEYDLSQNVRVSEFIRSQDASGEKAYPTFEAVENF